MLSRVPDGFLIPRVFSSNCQFNSVQSEGKEVGVSIWVEQVEQWVSCVTVARGENVKKEAEKTREDVKDSEDFERYLVDCRLYELALAPYFLVAASCKCTKSKLANPNSLASGRERTIPTERSPLVGQLLRTRGVGSLWPYSRVSRPQPLIFLPSSSSIALTRLSGPRSRPLLRKSGSAGNRTRTSGSVARNSDH
jgi:hypothetical protein